MAAMTRLDSSEVKTVVDLAQHMVELREAATSLQQTFETRERGYFTPSEEEHVFHLWVSYHKSRRALLELIDEIRVRAGEATVAVAGEFAVAYGAALVLIDAARSLRHLFGDNRLVREKLNEAHLAYGIEQGSFDAIQKSLTRPANAIAIRDANAFYDEHRAMLDELAREDSGLRAVLDVVESLHESTRVAAARYLKALARERGREAFDQVLIAGVQRSIYALQEWGSRLISNISTIPDHVPGLPKPIESQLLESIRPGDIFVTRKENALTNYFLPGYWPHAAMYVGDQRVIESLKDGVRERTMESPFGNDAVALIRPNLDREWIGQAIERARKHVGKPYDFNFDFTRSDRLVCTEVVYRSYEGLGGMTFKLTRRAGRQTLSAEDLLALALSGRTFLPVAVYCPERSHEILQGDSMNDLLRATMAPVESEE